MAKDRKKLQHIHSSIPDKQPTPSTLEVGEIAVNNAKGQEFLSVKNSEDKVVRFSSDGQLIEWIERKEVMPYEGFTRGSEGPTGSTGPDSVTNDDLLQNKSNIIIKLNQVAADNTVKHDKVNGAKDIYNKPVNPTEDFGVSDGAGFAIDMSRYAMIDANPSFSSLTVTVQTDLSGNTTISNGANANAYGTDSGHTFTIKTTDVIATDTNWTETIANQNSTITTLNESATTRTTKIGTENLNVSGTTTEVKVGNVVESHSGTTTETKKGNVTENNLANKTENTTGNVISNTTGTTTELKVGNVTENTSGTTTIDRKGDVSENNQKNVTVVTSGNNTTTISGNSITNVSGNTCITSQASANFYGKVGTNIGTACDGTTKASATTVIGTSTLDLSGATTTLSANSTTINSCGDYTLNSDVVTIQECATGGQLTIKETDIDLSGATLEIVENTSISAKTPSASLSGSTLVINEGTSVSAKTPTTTLSGTSLTITETNTDITSCGRISAKTDSLTIQECATGGSVVVNETDIDISGKTIDVTGQTLVLNETSSISAKTPTTTISGTNLTINESNTTISSCTKVDVITNALNIKQCATGGTAEMEFCGGYTIKSDDVKIQQCGTAGTISIVEKDTTISGGTLTIRESGATDFSGATLTETTTGNTTVNVGGNLVENVTGNTTVKVTGNTDVTVSGTTTIKTEDVTTIQTTAGDTNINTTGNTNITSTKNVNITSTSATNITATDDVCIKSSDVADFYGKTSTNIGTACDGTKSSATTIVGTNTVTISGATITETGTTVNISGGTTLNLSGTTINESGGTINIASSGSTNITSAVDVCINATDTARLYGKAHTYVGVNCDGTTGSAATISSTTINIGGTNINITGATKISGATTIGGETTINNNLNVTGNTNITGTTNISGATTIDDDLTVTGNLYLTPDCTAKITSTTVNSALCEVYDRSKVTMTVETPAATSEILKTYKLWQNDVQIGEDINIPKDHLLKSAEIVYGKVNGDSFTACTAASTDCHWYIKLVWNVFDPSTGHADDKITYMPADDLIKDIDDKNPNGVLADSYNNVAVNVWYDGEQNWVSATTTPTIHASENIYADGTVSGATVSGTTGKFTTLSAGTTTISGATTINSTLTVTGNTTLAAVSATSISATTVSSPTISGTNITASNNITTKDIDVTGNANITGTTSISGSTTIDDTLTVNDTLYAKNGLSKTLSWTYGDVSSATSGSTNFKDDKSFVIPQNVSNLNRGKLTITHNGLTDTFDPATDKSMTMPHSSLTISYGVDVSSKSGSDTYNTSGAVTVSIPTCVSHLKRRTLKWAKGSQANGTYDPGNSSCSGEDEIKIPGELSDLTNWKDGCLEVSGCVKATGFYSTSDERLKENIERANFGKSMDAAQIEIKQFNFKGDAEKRMTYGVIAQEVEALGLNELIHTDSDGYKSVDYTSLILLKLKYMENEIKILRNKIAQLENKD